MDPKLHRRVQRYGWDLAVEAYEQHWVPTLQVCAEHCVMLAKLRPGDQVLDVATGTGTAAFLAAETVGRTGSVIATDLSEKMVQSVQWAAERRALANVQCHQVDAEELAFPDASFDVVLCVLGLMYPADPQRAIVNIHRMVRSGGRVAVCVWGRRERCGWNAVFPIIDARVRSDVCPLFFSLGNQDMLARAFRQAGFRVDREERVSQQIIWERDEDAVRAIFSGGPVALAYSHLSVAERAAAQGEFLDSIAGYRHGRAYHVPGEFVYLAAERT